MNRRTFLQYSAMASWSASLLAAIRRDGVAAASEVLSRATEDGTILGASFCVRRRGEESSAHFGTARSVDSPFLLGSISKPMTVSALMTLFDQGAFRLEDPARRFLPEFSGDGRERVTIRYLLTHVSGLPDQLPENDMLRPSHAPLSEFVARALGLPLAFEPGSRFSYSSMAILLAVEIARRIRKIELADLMSASVFEPLGMKHSALGLGAFPIEAVMPCQTELAAPESGAGDPSARDWDWNSPYWRSLGAPWGGVHASAPDVARFLDEFLHRRGTIIHPKTAQLMISNQNPEGMTPRGIGFALGADLGGPGCSGATFGHTGSTGTLCWADPSTETICVILTTLPGRAVLPHPRSIASEQFAAFTS